MLGWGTHSRLNYPSVSRNPDKLSRNKLKANKKKTKKKTNFTQAEQVSNKQFLSQNLEASSGPSFKAKYNFGRAEK